MLHDDTLTFRNARYYDFDDGTPAMRKDGASLPVLYFPNGQTQVMQSIARFNVKSESISFQQFQDMLSRIGH